MTIQEMMKQAKAFIKQNEHFKGLWDIRIHRVEKAKTVRVTAIYLAERINNNIDKVNRYIKINNKFPYLIGKEPYEVTFTLEYHKDMKYSNICCDMTTLIETFTCVIYKR